MSRKKQEVTEEPATQGPTAYEMGRTGMVDDFYTAYKAASEDVAVKAAATKKSTDQYTNARPFVTKRYLADQAAFRAVEDVPFEMRREFHRGACEAFDECPDSIQAIMSRPEEFRRYSWGDRYLVRDTLIDLLDKSANPDTVLERALAKVADGAKKGILDSTLLRLVQYKNIDIERPVSALLKAGADAGYYSGEILALALHYDAPATVTDMLIENGAKVDEALQRMRDNKKVYGTLPYELVILQQAAEIRALKAELTEAKPQAPAAKTGTRLRMGPSMNGRHI